MPFLKNCPPTGLMISVAINPGKADEIKYTDLITETLPDARIIIPLPDDVDENTIRPGTTIIVEYELNNALFRHDSHIEYIISKKDAQLKQPCQLLISPQTRPEKIQRRKFFRVHIELPMRYVPVSIPKGYGEEEETMRRAQVYWDQIVEKHGFESFIFDISAGGIGFQANYQLQTGTEHYFQIELGIEILKAAGKIVYCRKKETATDDDIFISGVEFLGMSESIHDRIVGHVFRLHSVVLKRRREED
ncbi:MAG: PilZ domain-containing protein [Deltaproteobacteria bacterium]|nr:PilZ domain-containing protein [Deltaproteobacteria bacterium]